tara:strand:- start:518 stop:685 length:168 start_codon:yes stop_codon:yes gene_type:complete
MSKVFDYYNELSKLGLGPVRDESAEPTEEDMAIPEPSDAELAEIEHMIDNEDFLN